MNRPRKISRRAFLIGAGVVGGAAATTGAVWGLDPATGQSRNAGRSQNAGRGGPSGQTQTQTQAPATGPAGGGTAGPLVLVTLYGGNDGLNTVIPYADPAYAAARPSLGYSASQVLDIGDGLGLNAQLKGLHSLWQAGHLAVVRGVGYPNPNLSHFASMDIWQTANPTDGTGSGWLGRWLDATGDDPMRAMSVGATLPLALRGDKESATAITGPTIKLPGGDPFQRAFAALQDPGSDRTGLMAAVASAGRDLLDVQGQLDDLKATLPTGSSGQSAGVSSLAGQLAVVAALINAGAPTKVYQVSLASFDTHADEKANHERLLGELDQAVTTWLSDIVSSPSGKKAVLMTYSEFGRRSAQNASGGTDHGAAAPLFVVGNSVKGGFYGDEPSLTALDPDGNLVHNVDFRSVYATVLDKVVDVDPSPILGGSFPTLDFL
jgi:uncharacterized protein (DUF1501 family)